MKNNNGFTLIELMIVIAIIAIVASIAIPSYSGYLATSRMVEAKNNIAALKLAEEEYFLENNNYFEDMTYNNANLASASGDLWSASKGEGNTINFTYTTSVTGTKYTITATGNAGTPVAGKTESYSN